MTLQVALLRAMFSDVPAARRGLGWRNHGNQGDRTDRQHQKPDRTLAHAHLLRIAQLPKGKPEPVRRACRVNLNLCVAVAGAGIFRFTRFGNAATSHPSLAGVHRREHPLMLRLPLLLLLLGAMAAIEATGGRTKQAVVAGIMSGDTADRRALQASLGFGLACRADAYGNDEQRGNDPHDDSSAIPVCDDVR
jgi:hypothetical protein